MTDDHANGEKLTTERAIAAIQQYHGNITMAARTCRVARQTFYRFMDKHATVKAAREDAREAMLDHVESKLYSKAIEGDTACMIFFLKTQGYRRGYIERHEVSGPEGGAIKTENVNELTDDERLARIVAIVDAARESAARQPA